MKKKLKSNSAITLIALVITIIVLLILAGVSLSLIAGGDGILGKAESGTKEYRIASARELLDLKLSEIDTGLYENNLRKANFAEIVEKLADDNEFVIVGTELGQVSSLNKDVSLPDDLNSLKAILVCSTRYTDVIFRISNEREIDLVDEKVEVGVEKYTVRYDANGGDGELPSEEQYEKDMEIIISFPTMTKEGYKFLGWSTDSNATEATYTTEGSTLKVTENITLYAVFVQKVKPNYGTSIQNNYENLYLSTDPQVSFNEAGNAYDNNAKLYTWTSGNYYATRQLIWLKWGMLTPNESQIVNKIQGPNKQDYIKSGTKQYIFEKETYTNRWCACLVRAGFYTTNVYVSGLRLIFADENKLTLQEAVDNEYIEPLVLCNSESTNSENYYWKVEDIFTGGKTNTASFASLNVVFKIKNISNLTGIELYSNVNFNTTTPINGMNNTDGLYVYQMPEEYEISIEPFDV